MDVSQPGIDLLWDAAQIHVCPETGWSEYKAWYYENAGIDTTDLYGQIFHGPAVPTVPAIDATDYAALAGVYAAGLVDIDSLELSAGVGVADLTLSWGYHWSLEGNAPTQATLNLTWGDASGVRIVMPPTPVETWNFTEWVQPGWFQVEEGLGVGIERLRLADGTELDMAGLVALAPVGLLHPAVELERVDGTDGADSLSAAAPATWLTGAAGDDQLTGGAQPDVLVGGAGADRLVGGLGGDLYVFHAGDGHDHIVETASGAGDLDVIQLDEGPDVLTTEVLRNGHDLELWFGAGEGITIEGWYAYPAARVEQVVFAEGWVWDLHELERRAVVVNLPPTGQEPPAATATSGEAFVLPLPEGTFNDPDGDTLSLTATQPDGSALPSWLAFDAANATLAGTPPAGTGGDYLVALTATDPGGAAAEVVLSLRVQEGAPDPLQGNDELTGTDAADRLDGGPGDDVLHGSGGDDTLVGGPGADALHGGPGSDRLDGGPGDDALLGGWGSDTYAYRPGDGHDTILDTGPAWQIDRLVLGEGIDAADVALRRDGRDLVLDIAGTDGGITISNWFGAPWRRIERIETASGEVLLSTGVDRLVSAIAGFRASGTAEWAPTGAEPSPLAALLAAAWQREAA
jgi:Ca2+-binding RTX toxin-like protein